MSEKYFTWLFDSCYARNKKPLVKGESHKVSDFGSELVKHWVSEGAAMYDDEPVKKSKKEE